MLRRSCRRGSPWLRAVFGREKTFSHGLDPKQTSLHRGNLTRASFDHLVGKREQRRRQFETKRPGGSQVDHELVFGRLLERQLAGLLAAENAVDVAGGAAEDVEAVGAVERQASALHVDRVRIDRWQAVFLDERDDLRPQY